MVKEKLSNLYDIGSSKRVFQSEWREEGVPFYRAREIARLSEDGHVDNELFIDEDLYEEYTGRYGKPQPGDVMVTGVGTLGVCYVVKPGDKFYFKDGNILWFKQKAPDRILPEYLVKAFDSKEVKDFISKNSSGTTVGTFTIQTANKMEISLPPLDQQKEIIERISKLEAIIKKRQLELEMLDELIKARFVELTEHADAVPTHMGDIATYVNGYAFKPSQWEENGYPIIRIQNLNDPTALYNYYSGKLPDRYLIHNGDVLVSWATHLEAYIWKGEEAWLNQHIFKVIFDKMEIDKTYYVYACEDALRQAFRNAHGFKPTMEHIKKADFDAAVVKLPDIKIQKEFAEFVKQVDKSKVVVQKSLDETQKLFDSLMQEYFG